MRLLIIHQNFPGQFAHLLRSWSERPDIEVRGLGRNTAPGLRGFQGLTRYALKRQVRRDQHPYLRQMEAATLHGQAVARELLTMKQQGFRPDVILAHPGWGETLYAKDVFPDARLIHFCEWYYRGQGADIGFDPEFPVTLDDRARVRTWNALHSLNLAQCDAAVTPTHWQKAQHPEIFHPLMTVCHEGIDTEALGPDPQARLVTPNGTVLKAGDPVVTYVARNLEPYRGFHIFMRALEKIQRRDPRCHAVIVGGDEVSYGRPPKDAPNWRTRMLNEVTLDPTRTHFLGKVPYQQYRTVLQVSAAHVYLTYPFVLSWSLLEAMVCGANVIASDTGPVREVLSAGLKAKLVGFFDADGVCRTVCEALEPSSASAHSARATALQAAAQYGRTSALDGYRALLWPTHELDFRKVKQ